MFDPILIPLDGSQLAECVLPHAEAIARSFDAEMTLLHILENDRANTSAPMVDQLNWKIAKADADLYLQKIKEQYQQSHLRARVAVLDGMVAQGITEYAQRQGMKLIILSSHGQDGLTQWEMSSVAHKIILSAPTSLLIVRARQQVQEQERTPLYRRILVPLDGSQRAENVLPIITQLARGHQSQLHLVQVVQPPEIARRMPLTQDEMLLSNRVVARNCAEASRYLEQVSTRSYLDGIDVQTHMLTSESVATELHHIVEQEQIDLVALSAHGYSGRNQWPYGNITNNLIMYGKTSLLIVQDYPVRREAISVTLPVREDTER